jgi:hypothetical protein
LSRCYITINICFSNLFFIFFLIFSSYPIIPRAGFGWGGICIRAAERYGCKVTGITLSVEQKALAEQRVAAKGNLLCFAVAVVVRRWLLFWSCFNSSASSCRLSLLDRRGHHFLLAAIIIAFNCCNILSLLAAQVWGT